MFTGNVDSVSRGGVRGWAAATERPDDVVYVSVFVGGRKVAEIECDVPRSDLRQLGKFGDGRHGFLFNFPEPLSAEEEQRVTVRIAETGRLLNGGDALVGVDDRVVICSRDHDQLHHEPEPIPCPRNPRGLFEILALSGDFCSVYDVLSRVDFGGGTEAPAHSIVFGDAAAGPAIASLGDQQQRTRDLVYELLLSANFQNELIPLFLNAFAEMKRLIFVHVPKCAGTDLSTNLMGRFPFLHQSMTQTSWTTTNDLFRTLSRLVLNVRIFGRIFVTGHNSLDYYGSRKLIRPSDSVFTILRDPIKIVESQVNYVMTRLMQDTLSGNLGPDTRHWLDCLGLAALPAEMTPAEAQLHCAAILRCPQIIRPNSMCIWLGGNRAESALARLIEHNVEITLTDHYNEWLRSRWGIASVTRMNQSGRFISATTIYDALPHIHNLVAEDIRLYSLVQQAIRSSGKLSVFGSDLGRAAGIAACA